MSWNPDSILLNEKEKEIMELQRQLKQVQINGLRTAVSFVSITIDCDEIVGPHVSRGWIIYIANFK